MIRVAGVHDQIDAGVDDPRRRRPHAERDARRDPRAHVRGSLARQTRCVRPRAAPGAGGARHPHPAARARSTGDAAPRPRRALPPPDLPGPHAAGRRPRAAVPVHLQPLAVLAVLVRDPQSAHDDVRAREGAQGDAPALRARSAGGGCTFVAARGRHRRATSTSLFPGMEILDHGFFRVTRDADFEVSDEADDLLQAVEAELRRRRFGEVVRVEVDAAMSATLRDAAHRGARGRAERQVYDVDGLLDLNDLWQLVRLGGFAELRDRPWTPVTQPRLQADEDERGRRLRRDAPGRHPRPPPLRLVRRPRSSASSSRPSPTRTCSRSSRPSTARRDDSPLVPALIRAAERGKQAVALVELKARFDERANIAGRDAPGGGGRARRLRPPGAQDPRQVHPRRPPRGRRRAPLRARRHGQLPPDDGAPVHGLRPVHHRRGHRAPTSPSCSTTSPASRARAAREGARRARRTCATGSSSRSTRTIAAKQEGRHARIAMKMNALVDRRCIDALYARLAGRRAGRPQRPRHLLPAARRAAA